MKLNEVHQIEKASDEVWVVSPNLHFDVNDKQWQKLVKSNLAENTSYKYIVPNNEEVRANVEKYKKKYKLNEAKIAEMFLFLPSSEWSPFLNECAIYNPKKRKPVACAAPHGDCSSDEEVIRFNDAHSKEQVTNFKNVWKRYKRQTL